jgi:hypothetical protein
MCFDLAASKGWKILASPEKYWEGVSAEEGSWEDLAENGRILFAKMLWICSRYGTRRCKQGRQQVWRKEIREAIARKRAEVQ